MEALSSLRCTGMVHIFDLPDEILVTIVKEFPFDDQQSLRLVCKRFHDVVGEAVSFLDGHLSTFHLDRFSQLVSRFQQIREIHFRIGCLPDEFWRPLTRLSNLEVLHVRYRTFRIETPIPLPQLRRLILLGTESPSVPFLSTLARYCSLEELRMISCETSYYSENLCPELVLDAPLLQILELRLGYLQLTLRARDHLQDLQLGEVTFNQQQSLTESFPSIRRAFLSSRAAKLHEIAALCPRLTDLRIDQDAGWWTDVSWTEFAKSCTQLRSLRVAGYYFTEEDVMGIVTNLHLLRTLMLDPLRFDVTQMMMVIAENCPDIVDLKIPGATFDPSVLKICARACPNLNHLQLSCDKDGLLMLSHFTQLQSLSLFKSHVDATCMSVLVTMCPLLTKFRLLLGTITGDAIETLMMNCSQLHALKLNTLVIDSFHGSAEWIGRHGANLDTLLLVVGSFTDDEALISVARGCPKLSRLTISSDAVTPRGLLAVAQYCTDITELELYLNHVSSPILLKILNNFFPKLRKVIVGESTNAQFFANLRPDVLVESNQ